MVEIEEIKNWYVVPQLDFNELIAENNKDSVFAQKELTVRWALDESECLVNLLDGEVPLSINHLIPLSLNEVRELMKLKKWTEEIVY